MLLTYSLIGKTPFLPPLTDCNHIASLFDHNHPTHGPYSFLSAASLKSLNCLLRVFTMCLYIFGEPGT